MLRLLHLVVIAAVPTVVVAGPRTPDGGSPPAAPGRTVVLELFTSQGCSSCPPADRLLARLGREGAVDGVAVVPLAFHVDYWDYIGWQDPFASARWSARQRRYAAAMGGGRVYTPQLVLNGRAELVGSDERRVRASIVAAAPERQPARIGISHLVLDRDGAEVEIGLRAQADGAAARRLLAMVALFENALLTPVESGENARRTLENQHVVRILHTAFALDPGERRTHEERLRFELDPSWESWNLGVAVFLQDPDSMAIHAAAAQTLGPGH